MLKPYRLTYEFYYDGELRYYNNVSVRLLELPISEEYAGTDFEGLWDLTYKYAAMMPLCMYEFKKGKRFLESHNAIIRRITPKNCKSWKLVITSKETTISMERLMKFDSDEVIQYLKERGMTACPILK